MQKNEAGIKQFFQEMYETYIKFSMNPFYEVGYVHVWEDWAHDIALQHETPIKSHTFEQKAIFYGRKFLTL